MGARIKQHQKMEEQKNRKSIRLKNYDYSQENYYFITICTVNRECLFGKIENYEIQLNRLGQIVAMEWENIAKRYENIILDEYVVIPNHLHGIIQILPSVGAPLAGAQESMVNRISVVKRAGARPVPTDVPMLGNIIGSFKSLCVYNWLQYIKNNENAFDSDITIKFWQRNYYEHIVRNEKSLNRIRNYIESNLGI